jgi:Domain of unknown function (DUF4262)
MINSIGNRVKAGQKFEPGKGYADIVGNFDVQFRPMHPSHYCDWLNFACWFYSTIPRAFPSFNASIRICKVNSPGKPGCEQWAIEQQPVHDQPKPAGIEKS